MVQGPQIHFVFRWFQFGPSFWWDMHTFSLQSRSVAISFIYMAPFHKTSHETPIPSLKICVLVRLVLPGYSSILASLTYNQSVLFMVSKRKVQAEAHRRIPLFTCTQLVPGWYTYSLHVGNPLPG